MVYLSKTTESGDKRGNFESGSLKIRELVDTLLEKLILPQSSVIGFENLEELFELSKSGHSCLLLLEHYSNFDIPSWYYLLKNLYGERGIRISEKIISMATAKLTSHSDVVRSFAQAYPRIPVIAPPEINKLRDKPEHTENLKQALAFNHQSFKQMITEKNSGSIILIFPAGTRFRPNKPETKIPIPQMDSFIRQFDYVTHVGSSGILLEVNETGNMADEFLQKDALIFEIGKVTESKQFRTSAKEAFPQETQRDAIAKTILRELDVLHTSASKAHTQIIASLGDSFDHNQLQVISE